jgi:hypothetical protein
MLNLCRESQGYIHSFKSSRENVKHGPHTLGWSKVLDFEYKIVRNGHVKN